jgi:hypothetical protein
VKVSLEVPKAVCGTKRVLWAGRRCGVVLLPVEVVACRCRCRGGVARHGALLGDTTSMAVVSSLGGRISSGREGVSLLMPSALRVVCEICLLRSGCFWSREVGVLLVEVGVSCLGQGSGCLSCRGQDRGVE